MDNIITLYKSFKRVFYGSQYSLKDKIMILYIGLFILMFVGLNFYLGTRVLQLINIFHHINHYVYWIIFWVIALSYVVSKIGRRFLPENLVEGLNLLGSYWLATMFFTLGISLLVDLFRLINGRFNFININPTFSMVIGIGIIALVMFILIYGTINATSPAISKYEIKIDKELKNSKEINIVMASDIHIGSAGYKDRMEKLVELTNSMNPDVVLLVGDIIDDSIEPFVKKEMGRYFEKLESTFGTYAVTGNHEYISGKVTDFVDMLREHKVTVLEDEGIKINDSFYIIGRNDVAVERFTGEKRKTLKEISNGFDEKLPIIVMDHQPKNLQEVLEAGVDLQVSGHTHKGQISPGGLVTSRIFEVDFGYLKKESLNVVVSSGFGSWGPPIRIGSRSEIVNIKIK